jgi:hypothetical protein
MVSPPLDSSQFGLIVRTARLSVCRATKSKQRVLCVCILLLLAGAWADGRIAACLPGDFFVLRMYLYLAAIANEFR